MPSQIMLILISSMLLTKYDPTLEVYRVERNGVVHHDKYSNPELEWVDTARKAKLILNGEIEKIGISEEQILQKTAVVIARHLDEFAKSTQRIKESVSNFLDMALPTYEIHAKKTIQGAATENLLASAPKFPQSAALCFIRHANE